MSGMRYGASLSIYISCKCEGSAVTLDQAGKAPSSASRPSRKAVEDSEVYWQLEASTHLRNLNPVYLGGLMIVFVAETARATI